MRGECAIFFEHHLTKPSEFGDLSKFENISEISIECEIDLPELLEIPEPLHQCLKEANECKK